MTDLPATEEGDQPPDNSFSIHSGQLANAVQLASKQDQIAWTIFGVFWPANAILLIALFTTGGLPSPLVGVVVSVAGLVFSIVWAIIQHRAIAYLNFYEAIIHRIEEHHLGVPPEIAISGWLNKELFATKLGRTWSVRPLLKSYGIASAILWLLTLIWFVLSCCAP